ncbi:hypothetical protein N7457_005366 [Penicillium paradoxum]|uniref:uncharacterized protein n=1 Tax=Penicillium paradoxum TaxID=176176 RepID=UPI0025492CA9|nr:uncharacterized protein N7457_005366 [Penicillium paradoxum]KAJ5780206.1 hypothetical protein N7457_005366 [Penicillium paradoxum]
MRREIDIRHTDAEYYHSIQDITGGYQDPFERYFAWQSELKYIPAIRRRLTKDSHYVSVMHSRKAGAMKN